MSKSIGAWAFIIGLIVAILIAIVTVVSAETIPTWSIFLLAVLGLIVGFLNVTGREVTRFLVASIAFLVTFQSLASIVANLPLGSMISTFFGLITVFIGPAAAIVAVKALFAVTKD
ncbi:MAG: hypothetical protein NTV63_02880 [Candidatus Woesearchaeota archaeon]|nr:hypothetical protein [Candidatus Woesearchaeota archaeon]